MATIGQNLTNPENGWIRVDDVDSRFKYIGPWLASADVSGDWNNTQHYTKLNNSASIGTYIEFKTRNSFRFIGPKTANCSTDISIYINSVLKGTINQKSNITTRRCLLFEYLKNDKKEITVKIVNNTTKYLAVDAIDFAEPTNVYLLKTNDNIFTIVGNSLKSLEAIVVDYALFEQGFTTLTKENCELIAQELGKCKILRAKI